MHASLPDHLRLQRASFERAARLYPLSRLVPATLHGVERLPAGAALLVGNHGPFAMDTALLVHAVHREVGRVPRSLGDRMVFATSYGRALAHAFGSVEASQENALQLLAAGEWALVYPGGAREAMLPPERLYDLSWEGRYGFARLAIAAQAPIVPVACVGLDQPFRHLVTREQARQSAPGRLIANVLGEKYVTPLFMPRARRSAFDYWFGEPILPPASQDTPDLEAAARTLQSRVKRALQTLLTHGRGRSSKRRDPAATRQNPQFDALGRHHTPLARDSGA